MIRRLVFLAILLFGAIYAPGQSYYFRHYQVENGLSNNAIICSVQDKKGFLWFGTKDGLDRFDGYSFKIFRNDPEKEGSIGSNFIHSLYVDNDDVLWVGTEKGLYQYDARTESFSVLLTPIMEQTTDIQMDMSGNLWFISNFNLFNYSPRKKKLQHFPIADYFEATSICTMPSGAVYVSTPIGLLKKYNPADNSFTDHNVFSHSPKTVSTWIEKIYATATGSILVGTSNQGVKLFNPFTNDYKDILTYNADKTEIFARNFVQTSPDECWIATESGIFIYNMNTGEAINLRKDYDNPYSISDNAVYTFCKDREGGIWAGTYFGGVNYYPKQAITFQKYFPEESKNSLSGNVVREIHQDQYGSLWIGTEDAGLNKFDTANGRFTVFTPTGNKGGISYTNIHGLLATGNELWIGTFEHGLDVMNIQTGKVMRHYSKSPDSNSLKSNFIYCITQTADREILLGTTIGAYRYNRSTDNFSPIAGLPLFMWYSALLKDNNGIIWAATYGNGLNYFNTLTNKPGNFRYDEHNKNSLASDRINSLFQDSYKNLWIATEGGLCRYDPTKNNFIRYTTKNGFPTNFILSLLEDAEKNLWVSTSKGLVRFNPKTEQINVYTRANGLLNDQFNFSSAFKNKQGRMYFGSVKGMISFHPGEFIKNNYAPAVYFTGFQVNNEELAIQKKGSPLTRSITNTEKITLRHHQSTFSIDFASLSYSAPEMSEYAYKMEGLDNDWTYLKTNRKVYFTDLSPGTYTFKVKTAGSNGEWNVSESSLIIEILPPWWTSTIAYILYTMLAVSIIYYFARNYHNRVKEKNERKIEQLEIAKEKELYEAKMQFFTNVAHEIKTPLTLIKGPLEKVMKKAGDIPEIKDSLRIMSRNTDRLVDLTNQLLDFRQTEIKGFSLTFIKQNIPELLEEIFISFKPLAEQKELSFYLAPLPQQLFAFIDTDAFTKIVTNLLSNAIKYAKSKVEVILLPVKKDDTSFTIEVKNDGYLIPFEMKEKIFEPFFRLKETEKQKGTGIGLALSRSLAELQKGTLDLKEPENNMNVFFITIPLQQDSRITVLNEQAEKNKQTIQK
ncbi:MAG TPA: two-component regulator propeller domain-containing protein [Chitinophagaceae bacterium]|nr:two-component regulator propeller domain-containing protein [Chitinophagaceae bacterium]